MQGSPALNVLPATAGVSIRVLPGDTVAGVRATDSRFFTAICDRVYRFAPFRMSKAQRASIHAADEYLGIDAFGAGIDWYRRLIEAPPAAPPDGIPEKG